MRGSVQDIPVAMEAAGVVIRLAEWGEMNVGLETFPAGTDTEPVFKGLPDDRCQCPHWGYVIKGQLRYHFADREEVFNAGDVYYAAPGHTPLLGDDTEYVEFSPADLLQQTMEVIERNMAAAQV